ncbi:MAG: DUF4153 domain-containing protein [Bacteroidales bacterium]|nr:DUF4153 domain-containing protein [Bacteroidales bacterium]
MKTIDFSYFQRKVTKAFLRFPFVVMFILLATVSSLIDYYGNQSNDIWTHLFLTSVLAIPLFISINLYLERVETQRWFNIFINVLGFVILIIYFVNLPYKYFFDKHFIRSFVLFLAFIVSMFYLPFIGFHQSMPFWFYNYNFLKRIFISFLYSSIFFLGLLLALFAIWGLFEVDTSRLITPLAIVFYIFVFPLMIISGLSPKFTYHADKTYYPKYLRILSQYILMPIVSIYAIILIIYAGKVLFTGVWPSGYTVILVISYSACLLLIIAMLHPIFFENENKNFRKLVYAHLVLSLLFMIMYFVAIFKRIEEYGLTEHRLFVLLFGIWFVFITFYILLKTISDLRIITLSLLLLLFLSVTGPWNIFAICKKNQLNRLINIAKSENIWNNGKIDATNKIINEKSVYEMSSIALYLVSTHGYKSIQNIFNINADSLFLKNYENTYDFLAESFKSVGLTFNLYYSENQGNTKYEAFYVEDKNSIFAINDGKFLCNVILYRYPDSLQHSNEYKINNDTVLMVTYIPSELSIKLNFNKQEDAVLWLEPFYNYLREIYKQNNNDIPCKPNDLKLVAQGKHYNYTFYLKRVEFEKVIDANKAIPTVIEGFIIVEPIKK